MSSRRILLVGAALAGCVLRSTDAPRYFRPESVALSPEAALDPSAPTMAIRLRTVRARPFLRERIVWRTPDEYGMYEQRRWSELPQAYVERTLASALRQKANLE